ncbi:hypothetical protein ACH5RR_022165 [Cinchona calisaya]|uniref:Cyclin-dependent kinase inhibitor n=1 Tax=Cinchona calisaya TaxID=153742 RepID=A0ABD2Z723_9GENT
MGDFMRKCERDGGEMAEEEAAATTEVRNVGGGGIIRMRAMKEEEENEEITSCSSKRHRIHLPAISVLVSSSNSTITTASDVGKEKMRSTDLKHKDSETEISTFKIGQFSRETSPSSEVDLWGEEFMESSSTTTTEKKSSPRNSQFKTCVKEMPSAAEIEEFFAAAEKQGQKRFAEKYNYDVVKDVPLKGRYEWVRLKP